MGLRFLSWSFALLALPLVLAGCGSFLPASGPLSSDVVSQESVPGALSGYVLVNLDERVASITASQPRESFKRVFTAGRPAPNLRIGVSDSVVVTIWEAAAGGLFSASPGDRSLAAGSRTASIPEQLVARDGTIEVPYAGRLKVAGLTPAEAEQEI